ncbi:MAG: tRNA dihydrouridine synthase [Bacteriovoracaceae bacterium]
MAYEFTNKLKNKINALKQKNKPICLGSIHFESPLLLAPMSQISNAPFRYLMQELGSGGSVSELISCHGINYRNQKTLDMLKVWPEERNVGIQLFGEDAESMKKAADFAQSFNPKFIDINMGCPVRKVVSKGGGSALMKDPAKLEHFFKEIKSVLSIPLTIKIRTGWDSDSRNAQEIVHIAKSCGVEFVAIHGRTRTQQYKGSADWEYIEHIASENILPIIGNGDLHDPVSVKRRVNDSLCNAFMLGRGPLRSPFLFLEAVDDGSISFTANDYFEVIQRLSSLYENYFDEKKNVINLRKHILWFSHGFKNSVHLRSNIFQIKDLEGILELSKSYFLELGEQTKLSQYDSTFMTSGHG